MQNATISSARKIEIKNFKLNVKLNECPLSKVRQFSKSILFFFTSFFQLELITSTIHYFGHFSFLFFFTMKVPVKYWLMIHVYEAHYNNLQSTSILLKRKTKNLYLWIVPRIPRAKFVKEANFIVILCFFASCRNVGLSIFSFAF